MNATELWELFMQTGAPAVYLMYKEAMHTEETDVSNSPGSGITGNRIQ